MTAPDGCIYSGPWGNYLRKNITGFQLPEVLARIQRGESIDFGRPKADQRALTDRKHAAAWPEPEPDIFEFSVSPHTGTPLVNDSLKQTTVDRTEPREIPDFHLFLNLGHTLCHNLKG